MRLRRRRHRRLLRLFLVRLLEAEVVDRCARVVEPGGELLEVHLAVVVLVHLFHQREHRPLPLIHVERLAAGVEGVPHLAATAAAGDRRRVGVCHAGQGRAGCCLVCRLPCVD